jgi:predicted deacylase
MVERCLARFLEHVGAIDADGVQQYLGHPDRGANAPGNDYSMDDPGLFLFAERPGIFEPAFRLGETVCAGQVAGYLYDAVDPWREPDIMRFESNGVVLCVRTFALVEPGDCVAHLAKPI